MFSGFISWHSSRLSAIELSNTFFDSQNKKVNKIPKPYKQRAISRHTHTIVSFWTFSFHSKSKGEKKREWTFFWGFLFLYFNHFTLPFFLYFSLSPPPSYLSLSLSFSLIVSSFAAVARALITPMRPLPAVFRRVFCFYFYFFGPAGAFLER